MKNVVIFLFLIFTCNSFAFTGNDLHTLLNSENRKNVEIGKSFIVGATSAMGYYQGLENKVAELEKRKQPNYYHICIPEGAIIEQAIDIVKKYLDDHPESRSEGAIGLIHFSLVNVWECKFSDYR